MNEPNSFDRLKATDQDLQRFAESLGDEKLLTREQAAVFLSVSPRTIRYWCSNTEHQNRRRRQAAGKSGKLVAMPSRERLPFVRLGGKVFVLLGDLRRFRDERKVAA